MAKNSYPPGKAYGRWTWIDSEGGSLTVEAKASTSDATISGMIRDVIRYGIVYTSEAEVSSIFKEEIAAHRKRQEETDGK